jgi:predicted negative regulator of RcsB-dependent stress response
MKRTAIWVCSIFMPLVALIIIFRYGISFNTIFILLVLLGCPVVVGWQAWRISKQTEKEISASVRKENSQ